MASKLQESSFADQLLLEELWERYCAAPFPRGLGFSTFWLDIWASLTPCGRRQVVDLPVPCLNHLESRDRKAERSEHLRSGLSRIQLFEEQLFLDGLRLYPHELCRTAETIGPLAQEAWNSLCWELSRHRLWLVEDVTGEDEFWRAAENLTSHRDLPQPVLDYLDQARPKEKAPVGEFRDSLVRYLLRRKIEQMRDATYRSLREFDPKPALESGRRLG